MSKMLKEMNALKAELEHLRSCRQSPNPLEESSLAREEDRAKDEALAEKEAEIQQLKDQLLQSKQAIVLTSARPDLHDADKVNIFLRQNFCLRFFSTDFEYIEFCIEFFP